MITSERYTQTREEREYIIQTNESLLFLKFCTLLYILGRENKGEKVVSEKRERERAVSYTHLTLPTKRIV